MRKVIVYVDGFNLYHAIEQLKRPELKWLNLRAVAEGLLRKDEVLKSVKYFSAYATWKPDGLSRHKAYVAALRSVGIDVHLGQFKEKPRRCRSCNQRWTSHEEKETDVQIAVHMVSDALAGACDRIILISADTDLAPPIKMIAQLAPHVEVFVATPPNRYKICRALGPKMQIGTERLEAAQFADIVQVDSERSIERPANFRANRRGL
ncbi:NYN domain-containing protein [Stakelama tenebrarum]|uniref:NYN domain-containing protein n=1 Tax=Stakelama tenebrarum TaxID=2711215 RepID=A0A6G6Y417_9SPHN|nr:NYN domain-containing protein [Sphingosinithalassobacter tenebrarum]QIG79591.1 NYN domain-containing protein [Sphingosinithalassobacter tenebrarum]